MEICIHKIDNGFVARVSRTTTDTTKFYPDIQALFEDLLFEKNEVAMADIEKCAKEEADASK